MTWIAGSALSLLPRLPEADGLEMFPVKDAVASFTGTASHSFAKALHRARTRTVLSLQEADDSRLQPSAPAARSTRPGA